MMHDGNPFALPRPTQVRWVTEVYDQDADPAATPDDPRRKIYDGANQLARRTIPAQGEHEQRPACSGTGRWPGDSKPVPCWLHATTSMILRCPQGHEWGGDYCVRHVQALRSGAGLDKEGHPVEIVVEVPL